MTAPLPTPGEVEGMRERHVPTDLGRVEVCCQGCEDTSDGCVPWPCDAARLLALVGNQSTTLDEDKLYIDDLDARLAAVFAMTEEVERANGYGRRIGYTLSREQHAHDLDRIRRAATGEAT